jgi:hypothetical protein
MNNKPFEVDINNKIRKMKTAIDREWPISNNDVDILVREYEKLEKRIEMKNIMINLMALDLEEEGQTKKEVIEKYEEGALKWMRVKKK